MAEALNLGPGDLLADAQEVPAQDLSRDETITLACQAIGISAGVAVTVMGVLQLLDVNQGLSSWGWAWQPPGLTFYGPGARPCGPGRDEEKGQGLLRACLFSMPGAG